MTTSHSGANPFIRASINEREYIAALAETLNVDSYYPQPNRSPFDCILMFGELTAALEAKVRKGRWDDYDTTLIEQGKYNSLMRTLTDKLVKMVMYVEFFPASGLCLAYNLGRIAQPEWSKSNFVKNSVMNNGYIEKSVGYLDKSLAKKIEINM
ncbi:hypothetical protein BH11BAC1_BH11BAC1_16660 [soil metagenome]